MATTDAELDELRRKVNSNIPFSIFELESSLQSFQNLEITEISYTSLQAFLRNFAHLSHKDFDTTRLASEKIREILPPVGSQQFQVLFQHVLQGGNWSRAYEKSLTFPTKSKPWAVLVTGLNGIRKTTSVNSPWFINILQSELDTQLRSKNIDATNLPTGDNSFFRQLDYLVATVANNDFKRLYEIEDAVTYAKMKDLIFARYRTLAEICGVILIDEAKKNRMNVLVETSGRDVAMFNYIDTFFSDDEYNKLVIHFSINELKYAEKSVESRMNGEIIRGKAAIEAKCSAYDLIKVNSGGPYGPSQLKYVQDASNAVMLPILSGASEVGRNWLKASINIIGSDTEPWLAKGASESAVVYKFN